MRKNINDVAEQMKADPLTRASLQIMVDKLDERAKKYLLYCYSDPELLGIYEAMRQQAAIDNRLSKTPAQRKIISFPNQIIFKFLDDLFSPRYGKNWLMDQNTLLKICRREELIKPWIVGKI